MLTEARKNNCIILILIVINLATFFIIRIRSYNLFLPQFGFRKETFFSSNKHSTNKIFETIPNILSFDRISSKFSDRL